MSATSLLRDTRAATGGTRPRGHHGRPLKFGFEYGPLPLPVSEPGPLLVLRICACRVPECEGSLAQLPGPDGRIHRLDVVQHVVEADPVAELVGEYCLDIELPDLPAAAGRGSGSVGAADAEVERP